MKIADGVSSNTFKEILEKIKSNIRWMDRNFQLVSDWLSSTDWMKYKHGLNKKFST